MRWNMTQEAVDFVEANPAIFRGNAKLTAETREKLYLIYNEVFSDSKRPTGCGACQRTVIKALYNVYLKYKEEQDGE